MSDTLRYWAMRRMRGGINRVEVLTTGASLVQSSEYRLVLVLPAAQAQFIQWEVSADGGDNPVFLLNSGSPGVILNWFDVGDLVHKSFLAVVDSVPTQLGVYEGLLLPEDWAELDVMAGIRR